MTDAARETTHLVSVPASGPQSGPKSGPGSGRGSGAKSGDGAGGRLDRLLADRLPQYSRSRLKVLIEDGRVSCAGATISEPSYRVKPGQSFTVTVPAPTTAAPLPEPIALDIVYEDAHLLVLDKPAGLVVHPAPGNAAGTLVNALLAHCGDSLSGIGGVRRPGIIHRLDKDTSGLMVVAKTDMAHADLSAQFAGRTVARAYTALVWGVPRPGRGEIAGNIGRNPQNRKKMAVVTRGGRTALTRYRVIRAFGSVASLVECRLATGRTHQIRVHLAHRLYPVIGDATYGGGARRARQAALGPDAAQAIARLGRQALHARLLGFRHPASAGMLEFESNLPLDMKEIIDCLETI